MSYSQFTIDAVQETFDISISDRLGLFENIPPIEGSEFLMQILREYSPLALAIGTEKSRSEFIIAPILFELRRQFNNEISLFLRKNSTSILPRD